MSSDNRFDQRAKTWDRDPVKVARALAVADGIRSNVPLSPGMRALEYGCGTGLLSFSLQPYLAHITLADNSTGMLEVLKEKIESAQATNMLPIRLDLVTDPLPRERYDLIYTLMTFHHIGDTDRLLHDLFVLLTSPGYLCVADLDAEDGSFHGPEFTGHKGFPRNDFGSKAKRAGFRNVHFTTPFHITRPESLGQTDFPLFLMVAEK
jgi:ubiquinone/menaquinone biosynthesis C-methylase UbiE